jgi:hypothetical protein
MIVYHRQKPVDLKLTNYLKQFAVIETMTQLFQNV